MNLEEQQRLESDASQMEGLFNNGQYADLEILARAFVARRPDLGFGWSVLGASLQFQGKDALPALRKAAELLPTDASAHSNLGDALQSLGRFEDAIESYLLALEVDPNVAETHVNLGNALKARGQLADAEASYRRALGLKPEFAEAHYNLGLTLREFGRLEDAEVNFRRAIQMNTLFGEARVELGSTLRDMGRLAEAEDAFRQAIQLMPLLAEAHANLGATLRLMSRPSEAEACFRLALDINPELAEARSNLGAALRDLGRAGEAEASFRQAVSIDPQLADAHSGLAATLRDLGRFEEAVASSRTALRIDPSSSEAQNNLGVLLSEFGQFEEAELCLRRAIQIDPMFAEAYSNRLFHLSHMEAVDAKTLFAEHLKFAAHFETPLIPKWPRHTNQRDPDRTLRIGFVSADLRTHPVSSFLEPVLACLAARPKLSLYAYHNHSYEDTVTERLKVHVTTWRSIAGLSDEAAAQRIIDDGIDILVDLSGHTAKHRLLTFARKPAPIQFSWIGYAGTTGLSAMDYYMADRFFLPTGVFDDLFSEKIVRTAASNPFLPFKDAPPVNALPVLRNSYLTFGSFNFARKLTPSVIALWAEVLRAVPDARMLIGGMHSLTEADKLADRFTLEGIARSRLTFHQKCEMQDYLKLHHQVDFCLDTFPYPGATTSCHALWMGVPTLTMTGETLVSRVGASLQFHAGLAEFVANSKAEFVKRAVYWSCNHMELATIRAELRDRFSKSGMGRPEAIAASFDRAMRIMWHRWCDRLPAESIDVL